MGEASPLAVILVSGHFAAHALLKCCAAGVHRRYSGCNDRETGKSRGSPYSITERRVPELIPVLGSQPAGDVSQKPGGRLPLLSARPAFTLATLKRAATNLAAWRAEAQ